MYVYIFYHKILILSVFILIIYILDWTISSNGILNILHTVVFCMVNINTLVINQHYIILLCINNILHYIDYSNIKW